MHILNLKICDGSPTSNFFSNNNDIKVYNQINAEISSLRVIYLEKCSIVYIFIDLSRYIYFLFFVTTIFASLVSVLLTLVRVSKPDTWLAKMRLLRDIYILIILSV